MATRLKKADISGELPDCSRYTFGIVMAEFNTAITSALLDGVMETLLAAGAKPKRIIVHKVPGAFELPLGAQRLAQMDKVDAVISLGCVIQGDTPHFDYICQACANGIMQVGLEHNKPVIFGVLTTLSLQQAKDRAGGKLGNKGTEAAVTAIHMLATA